MIQAFAKTDIGKKRHQNQDYAYLSENGLGQFPNLMILADGMGGHQAGDYASWFLTECITCFIAKAKTDDAVRVFGSSIDLANSLILEKASSDPQYFGMGSTLVIATVQGNRLTCANVGDSRLYLIRGRKIRQITKDHSYVEEMVSLGLLERDSEAYRTQKNIITRAVGIEKKVQPDFFEEELMEGDQLLLCSDGLSNMISDEEILKLLQMDQTPELKVNRLIAAANDNGGKDNIGVVLAVYTKGGDENA